MPEDNAFRDLLRRVRAGDGQAAAELVREFEPEIRREIRIRLTDVRLRRVLDSMDICQSVLGQFFVRAATGVFDLETPQQLLKLLIKMARNKLIDRARQQQAECRDFRRLDAAGAEELEAVADRRAEPSQIVANAELLHELQRYLSEEERYLAEQRAAGRDWLTIAAEVGGSAEALRKQLARAIDRVSQRLGLDEVRHGS